MMHLRNSRLMTMALSRTSTAGGELLGSASSSRRSRGCTQSAAAVMREHVSCDTSITACFATVNCSHGVRLSSQKHFDKHEKALALL